MRSNYITDKHLTWVLCVAQKKTSDLTKQLQQAEDTIKLAVGALKNKKRKQLKVAKVLQLMQYKCVWKF